MQSHSHPTDMQLPRIFYPFTMESCIKERALKSWW